MSTTSRGSRRSGAGSVASGRTANAGITLWMVSASLASSAACGLSTYGIASVGEGSSTSAPGTSTGVGTETGTSAAEAPTTSGASTGTSNAGDSTTVSADTSSSSSSSTGAESSTGSTGEEHPSCLPGESVPLESVGFHNTRREYTSALAFGPDQLTALFYSGGCGMGLSGDFGGGTPVVDPMAGEVLFLAQYNPALGHEKIHAFGGPGNTAGEGLAVDGAGNVYVAAYFDDEVKIPVSLGGGSDVSNNVITGTHWSLILVFGAGGDRLYYDIMKADGGCDSLMSRSVMTANSLSSVIIRALSTRCPISVRRSRVSTPRVRSFGNTV